MLSEKEEQDVVSIIEYYRELQKIHREVIGWDSQEHNRTIWLAEKLKEINNECSKYAEELQKANELSVRLSERFE